MGPAEEANNRIDSFLHGGYFSMSTKPLHQIPHDGSTYLVSTRIPNVDKLKYVEEPTYTCVAPTTHDKPHAIQAAMTLPSVVCWYIHAFPVEGLYYQYWVVYDPSNHLLIGNHPYVRQNHSPGRY